MRVRRARRAVTRVLGAGLSKTGTTSLHRGLQALGWRSLHYDRRLADVVMGEDSQPCFRRYDDVDAVSDIPAAFYFQELLRAYPTARCILTIRDEDEWWESVRFHFNERRPVDSRAQDPYKWRLRRLVYGSAKASEALFRERYRQHNQTVREVVPPDRLLILRVAEGEGWERLCPFLGEGVPSRPFPRDNPRTQAEPAYWRAVGAEIRAVTRAGSTLILADEMVLDRHFLSDRVVLPFTERAGEYWGPPEDGAAAIAEVERLARGGAEYLVFLAPGRWLLDVYDELATYLDQHHERILDNERMVGFALSAVGSATSST